MPTYLERYNSGEYAKVWKELVALDDAVMREPLLSDAYAVAQETMRRARQNIELLAERLENLGFEFYDTQIFSPPSKEMIRELAQFERKVGPAPLSMRAWIEEVGDVNFMGTYPRLSYYASTGGISFMMGGPSGQGQQIDLSDLLQSPKIADLLTGGKSKPPEQEKLNDMFSALQNAFSNLMGGKERGPKSSKKVPEDEQFISDPLVVDFSELSLDSYEEWKEYESDDYPFCVTIAPDIHHKSNISGYGGYEINLPHAAADAPLLNTEFGDVTFVEYLRLSFEWAGFPGLQEYPNRDEALLASLKEGLLPI